MTRPSDITLARDWRKETPPDRSPAYVADDLARAVLALHEENERLRAALAEALDGWNAQRVAALDAGHRPVPGEANRIADLRKLVKPA